MPLRDHFHSPWRERCHWESLHSAWANTIVRHLNTRWLPERFRAAPEVHLGAVWAPSRPSRTFAVDFPAQDVFEVRVYDDQRGQRLVAVVELVSPANKDRPEHRHAFAVKCAAYLRQQVSLVLVDAITERRDNLHGLLLQTLGVSDSPAADAPLYAVACRTTKQGERWQMDTWNERLTLGSPLPTLPLWLAADLAVPLELESNYEETCQVLRLT